MSRYIPTDTPFFRDDGTPNALGTVYFGEPGTNAKNNPKVPYLNSDFSTPSSATQNLTAGGKLQQSLYLNGDYSVIVDDSDGVQVDEDLNAAFFSAGTLPITINSLARDSVQSYLENKEVADYAALIALSSLMGTQIADGDPCSVTNTGIAGEGVFRNVVAHGLTSTVGVIVVINSDWYWERAYSGFVFVNWFGATGGSAAADTAAFYAALSENGSIDLNGLTLDVTVTSTTAVNKDVYIKNGAINFSAATALRVFTWVNGSLFRLEDVDIVGNSNGTIDDSFDATSGTIALIRAELTVDEAAKNLQLERSSVKQMIAVEDNKNAVTSATAFRVKGGYIRNCYFEDIPGHMFSSNSFVGIKITENEFKNIGALCVDFAALTSDCIFENNDIDGAAGIGKTQNRFNSGELILPKNNSISHNEAENLTSGNSSNVAVIKLSGKNDKCKGNTVVYDGGTAVESIEVFGSADVVGNDITRTVNTTRSYITTVTDANLAGVLGNPVINIEGNRGSGMLNFARLQNTSVARVTISKNRPSSLAKFVNGETGLNLPGLAILDNEYDTSATVGAGMQFNSGTANLERLKVHGNTCKSEGTGLVAYAAEGASVTGNTFEHTTGNNFDIISTNSYVVTGNGANAAWPATSSEQVVENNTVFV